MSDRAKRPVARWLAGALAFVALVFAATRAYSLAMASYWSEVRPAEALRYRASMPDAVWAKAESDIRARRPDPHRDATIRAALRLAPLEGRGYRYLAHGAQTRREDARAERLYRIAAARGPRDLPSQAWLGDQALRRGDYAEALARMDSIMRVQPEQMHKLNPVLEALAVVPGAQDEFAKMLASRPPWRHYVLNRLMAAADSARLFPMIERLRVDGGGLDARELSTWLDRLAASREWGSAYLIWVQSLSPEASQTIGNVFNGGFEVEPSHSGFDWRFDSVPGARVSRVQVTGATGNAALRVGFEDRRVAFAHVRQLMALAPGRYRLTGRVRLDDLRSDRGLVWTLTCAESRKTLGESEPMSGRRDWSRFEVGFEVPPTDCGGQWLVLRLPARIPAEQRIGGVAWFDDLKAKASR